MSEVIVAYWSGTGNTEAMAKAVGEGIAEAGGEPKVVSVEEISPDDLKMCSKFALGCPSMGTEVLEETVMEDFVAAVEKFATGKTIGLFGSYGWGDGQWMRDWVDRMDNAGANVIGGTDCICMAAPDDAAVQKCKDLGKALV